MVRGGKSGKRGKGRAAVAHVSRGPRDLSALTLDSDLPHHDDVENGLHSPPRHRCRI